MRQHIGAAEVHGVVPCDVHIIIRAVKIYIIPGVRYPAGHAGHAAALDAERLQEKLVRGGIAGADGFVLDETAVGGAAFGRERVFVVGQGGGLGVVLRRFDEEVVDIQRLLEVGPFVVHRRQDGLQLGVQTLAFRVQLVAGAGQDRRKGERGAAVHGDRPAGVAAAHPEQLRVIAEHAVERGGGVLRLDVTQDDFGVAALQGGENRVIQRLGVHRVGGGVAQKPCAAGDGQAQTQRREHAQRPEKGA